MQKSSNIEKEVNTDEEHLHLPPAVSPGISDPEQQPSPKIKTRSRFSSAIRKLSGSGRKKKSREQPKEIGAETQVVSSGGEETPSDVPKEFSPLLDKKDKKKGKLSKRFLGLGKPSKQVTPDNIGAEDIRQKENSHLDDSKSIEISKTREVTSEHEHTIRTPDISEISPTTSANSSPRRLDRIQKVQITISGKKIEHTKIDAKQRSITTTTTQITGGSRSETDYLLPNPIAELQDPPKTTTVTTIISGTSEPLKVIEDNSIEVRQKSITRAADKQELTSATSKQDKTTAVEKNITPRKSTSERVVVITQSSRDTPPREVAPIKPSNCGETEDKSPTTSKTNTGTVSKKTNARTALALPTITQKFKNKSPKSKNKSGKVISPSVEKANLMQNPPVIEQRGHRFPAPSTTSEVDESESPKIEFRAESHASPSPVVSTKEWQSQQSNASTEPPNYPPPSVPSSSNSSSPINTTLAAAPIATTTAIVSTAPLADIRESVLTVSSSALDDIVSSAESVVVPGNNIKNNKNTLGPLQPIDLTSSVLFSHKESRVDSLDSKDSDSDVSDTNRKRIHYIEQPSLTEEELTSLERRRESFKYHTEVSVREFTLDSSNEDSVDIEIPKMPAFGDLTMDQEMEPTIMTSANAEKREHLYKILVIGELGTGKTSFIKRYVHQFFSQNYRATIGVDFALKVLHWDANTIVRLQLWDIAGQERFGNMTRVYYKEAVGAFIVFDVTRSGTFECVNKWKEDLDSKVQLPDGSPIPCILLANKCDQDKQGIVTSPDKMEEYVRENGFAGWFETSAKENMNIDEAARALVNKILLNDKLISAADLADSEKFNLNITGDQTASESKSKCSC